LQIHIQSLTSFVHVSKFEFLSIKIIEVNPKIKKPKIFREPFKHRTDSTQWSKNRYGTKETNSIEKIDLSVTPLPWYQQSLTHTSLSRPLDQIIHPNLTMRTTLLSIAAFAVAVNAAAWGPPYTPSSTAYIPTIYATVFNMSIYQCGINTLTSVVTSAGLFSSAGCTGAQTVLAAIAGGTASLSSIVPSSICGNCVSTISTALTTLNNTANCAAAASNLNGTLKYDYYNNYYCMYAPYTAWHNTTFLNKYGTGFFNQINGGGVGAYGTLNASLGECTNATMCVAGLYGGYASLLTGNETMGKVVTDTIAAKLFSDCYGTPFQQSAMTSIRTCGPEPPTAAPTTKAPTTKSPTKAPTRKGAFSASMSAVTVGTLAALLVAKKFVF
jgi:hypothetical protein